MTNVVQLGHWVLGIAYDTTRPRDDDAAYRSSIRWVDYQPDAEDLTHGLHQMGAVWNGWVRYTGSYATKADAETAAEEFRRR
jgi:hypothetical protein